MVEEGRKQNGKEKEEIIFEQPTFDEWA